MGARTPRECKLKFHKARQSVLCPWATCHHLASYQCAFRTGSSWLCCQDSGPVVSLIFNSSISDIIMKNKFKKWDEQSTSMEWSRHIRITITWDFWQQTRHRVGIGLTLYLGSTVHIYIFVIETCEHFYKYRGPLMTLARVPQVGQFSGFKARIFVTNPESWICNLLSTVWFSSMYVNLYHIQYLNI